MKASEEDRTLVLSRCPRYRPGLFPEPGLLAFSLTQVITESTFTNLSCHSPQTLDRFHTISNGQVVENLLAISATGMRRLGESIEPALANIHMRAGP